VNSEKKSRMRYIYESINKSIDRAKKDIMAAFGEDESKYKVAFEIIVRT